MQVKLPNSLQAFVEEEVRSGHFNSPEQVIQAAVANLRIERELEGPMDQSEIEELRSELAKGVAQADRGELEPWDSDEIMREVERQYAEEQKSKAGR
jgi:putative addiction module CopG family antidote